MASTLTHRGPDDRGEWSDDLHGFALGFRRLSIIDLSPAGHQPMTSASGRYVIAFNGEVYNYEEIRRELESDGASPSWRGHSDTEVMLAAIERFGLVPAVQRFIGMFAFALWDRQEQTLHLCRDRVGVKPMYYGWIGQTLVFGSELKALRAFPRFDAEIDRDVLTLFLRHAYIPAPHTIYRGIRKLTPGTIITFTSAHDAGNEPQPAAYWSLREVAEGGVRERFGGSEQEAISELDLLLRHAVKLRMVSDVPLGVFLSGGIDSSVVTALMQAQSTRPVKTFSIGFLEDGFDEAAYAADVARHLDTDHTELYVSAAEARAVIPRLASMFDEPFADVSQIPTHLVSALARRDVTVALSGDGGDELFGGYNRYNWGRSIWRNVRPIPRIVRAGASRGLLSIGPSSWEAFFRHAAPLLPKRMRVPKAATQIAKLSRILGASGPQQIFWELVSKWRNPESVVLGSREPKTLLSDPPPHIGDIAEWMMYLDTATYLPDDILVKVDRASMAASLEAREPLLDHRLIEWAWRLPMHFKIRGGTTKWALRRVLDRYVPPALIDRPKMGFGVPIDRWLRGELREWAEDLLSEQNLRDGEFFDPAPIRAAWREHLAGTSNRQDELWTILMFQAWLRERAAPHRELHSALAI
jgi:asparagine synthase (glutamine-hydrolysing)